MEFINNYEKKQIIISPIIKRIGKGVKNIKAFIIITPKRERPRKTL